MSMIHTSIIPKLYNPVSISISANTDYICPHSGYISLRIYNNGSGHKEVSVYVNGAIYSNPSVDVSGQKNTCLIPVNAGDVVKYTRTDTSTLVSFITARWYVGS